MPRFTTKKRKRKTITPWPYIPPYTYNEMQSLYYVDEEERGTFTADLELRRYLDQYLQMEFGRDEDGREQFGHSLCNQFIWFQQPTVHWTFFSSTRNAPFDSMHWPPLPDKHESKREDTDRTLQNNPAVFYDYPQYDYQTDAMCSVYSLYYLIREAIIRIRQRERRINGIETTPTIEGALEYFALNENNNVQDEIERNYAMRSRNCVRMADAFQLLITHPVLRRNFELAIQSAWPAWRRNVQQCIADFQNRVNAFRELRHGAALIAYNPHF